MLSSNLQRKYIGVGFLIAIASVGGVQLAKLHQGEPPAVIQEPAKTIGDLQAETFLVVFSDFACHYCDKVRPVLDAVLRAYPRGLKIVYKHYLIHIHPFSILAAEASECAADQGMFWPYHKIVFDSVNEWTRSTDPAKIFISYAEKLRLDVPRFKQCYESGEKKSIVDSNQEEGRRFHISGTPTVILNGKKIMFRQHDENYLKEQISREIKINGK